MATISINGVDVEAPSTANTDRWQDAFTPVLEALAEGVAAAGNQSRVSVMDFGADNTGDLSSGDANRLAIRAAVAAAIEDGSRHIHFPVGTFRVAPIWISHADDIIQDPLVDEVFTEDFSAFMIVIPSDFKITGDGYDTIIQSEGDVDGTGLGIYDPELTHDGLVQNSYYLFWLDDVENVEFSDIRFVGMNDPFVYYLNLQSVMIRCWQRCRNIAVRDCWFQNLFGFSFHVVGGGEPLSETAAEYIHAIRLVSDDCANGVNINADYSIQSQCIFRNSEPFESTGAYMVMANNIVHGGRGGISVGGTGGLMPGCVIVGNVINGVDVGAGIAIGDAAVDFVCDGNNIQRCDQGGIHVYENPEGFSDTARGLISNNVINACGGSGAAFGMRIVGTGSHHIVGNKITTGDDEDYSSLSALIVSAPGCYVADNYLDGTNVDLVIGADCGSEFPDAITLGRNHLLHQTVFIEGTSVVNNELVIGANAVDYSSVIKLWNESFPRWSQFVGGKQSWGAGGTAADVDLERAGVGLLKVTGKIAATGGLGVGNSTTASAIGAMNKVVQLFDTDGNSLGYLSLSPTFTP